MGFPMEMDRFPGKIWVVSHKRVAVAAGLGRMGIHRNVIHPNGPRKNNFPFLDAESHVARRFPQKKPSVSVTASRR